MKKNREFLLVENMIALRSSTFFEMLHPTELRRIALICKEITLQEGELLIKRGDEEDHFYFIKQGEVEKYNEDEQKRVTKGDIIELHALFIHNHRSNYSVKALYATTILTFKKESLYDIVLNNAETALIMIEYFSQLLDR